MSMSKKDYELVANVIAEHRDADRLDQIRQGQTDELVARLSKAFKRDNASFQPALFKKACRVVNPRKVMGR